MLVTLDILGRLLVGGLVVSIALVAASRYGPHRLWFLAMFIGGIALLVGAGFGDLAGAVLSLGLSGCPLAGCFIALASVASAFVIQALRAWHTRTLWQIGAGTIAAWSALVSGVGLVVF